MICLEGVLFVSLLLKALQTSKMSSSSAYDVDPSNLIEVGFCRSGVLWAYKEENNCHLSPLPEYGSDGEPIEPVCICGWDSVGDDTSSETKTDAVDVVKPLFVCGPDYQAAGPSVVSCEATPLMATNKTNSFPEDDIETDEYTLDDRVTDSDKEEEVRANLYAKWCLQSWVEVASHTLNTDSAGRDDFCRRPHWDVVDKVVNLALSNSYLGSGNPPTMLG